MNITDALRWIQLSVYGKPVRPVVLKGTDASWMNYWFGGNTSGNQTPATAPVSQTPTATPRTPKRKTNDAWHRYKGSYRDHEMKEL